MPQIPAVIWWVLGVIAVLSVALIALRMWAAANKDRLMGDWTLIGTGRVSEVRVEVLPAEETGVQQPMTADNPTAALPPQPIRITHVTFTSGKVVQMNGNFEPVIELNKLTQIYQNQFGNYNLKQFDDAAN